MRSFKRTAESQAFQDGNVVLGGNEERKEGMHYAGPHRAQYAGRNMETNGTEVTWGYLLTDSDALRHTVFSQL
ncbi:hypothetical protein SKAU_G00316850 [Synaphobranchus kaupii]|uniref:Uncharacterized protein n=1 Tax=Synaphobranchus kaupii TaxID=118154 RepID=A0A9Q1EST1_SYNKA|nr:hypothetical protein SKAU_G00316850 [Synaphobranchus kaupii]